jgi:hypothetical protein
MNLQVPVSELQKKSLFVATPMYGGQCFGSYTKSILDLSRVCQAYGIQVQFSFIFNESLITRARNYLVDEFIRSAHTHMMFIDSDIDFNPMDVIYLLAMDKPIAGGPYPKKCLAWENIYDAVKYGLVPNDERGKLADFAGDFVFNTVPGTTQIKLDEPVEVLEIGTGFMMVERSVFTKFAEAYPQYWYTPDHNRSAAFDGSRKIYQYFQAEIEPVHGRYLSEDYWFCQKSREAGLGVWFAPWMIIKHHGTYIYSGSIPAMATVSNERIQRNDPAPSVVRMDGSKTTPAANAPSPPVSGPATIKQFSSLSASKRKELLIIAAEKIGVSSDVLQQHYKDNREAWLAENPESSIEEKLRLVKQ